MWYMYWDHVKLSIMTIDYWFFANVFKLSPMEKQESTSWWFQWHICFFKWAVLLLTVWVVCCAIFTSVGGLLQVLQGGCSHHLSARHRWRLARDDQDRRLPEGLQQAQILCNLRQHLRRRFRHLRLCLVSVLRFLRSTVCYLQVEY